MKMTRLATGVAICCLTFTAYAHDKNSAVDQSFVTKAAQGGLAEVNLGNVATAQGTSDDVKKFGKHMVDDHSKANDTLKSTATAEGAQVPDEPSAAQKATAAKLTALNGRAFDSAYAKAMVKDHKETIALFEKEASSGKDAKLKSFASDTLPTLKQHLKMAEDLQASIK